MAGWENCARLKKAWHLTCKVVSIQSYGGLVMAGMFSLGRFWIYGTCTNHPQCNLVRRVARQSYLSIYVLSFYHPHGDIVSSKTATLLTGSRLATEWLDENFFYFYCYEMTPKNPDLNPIELFWIGILWRNVWKHVTQHQKLLLIMDSSRRYLASHAYRTFPKTC